MPVYRLSAHPYKRKREGVSLKSVTGTRAQLAFVRLEPGTVTRHSHENEQIGFILSGGADLELDGEVHRLGPGDAYMIPSGVEHAFIVPADGAVEYAEVFAPPKEENRTI